MRKALKFYLVLVNTDLFVSHMVESLCDFSREAKERNLLFPEIDIYWKKRNFVGFLPPGKRNR